jgi:polysaccharide export outer membrane protein
MRLSLVAVAVLAAALSGCAVNRVVNTPLGSPAEYTLDTGDVVRVIVYGDATLSTTYTVTDNGTISFPLAGAVGVRGKTITAAERSITRLLADGYMVSPKVSVEITTYRPFFIDGAVTTSGQYAYVWGMTARAAVATAGGFKDYADRGRLTIFRKIGPTTVKIPSGLDAPILPGDEVVVAERWL